MLFAHEARQKTVENINKYVSKELTKINNQINKAVDKGNFYITNYGHLQSESKKKLEEAGYKVTTFYHYSKPSYKISWEHDKK